MAPVGARSLARWLPAERPLLPLRARFSLALFAFFALFVVLLGCSRAPDPAGAAHLELALNWVPEPELGGFYAARDGGAYKKAGLEIQGGGAGVPVVQMVAAGQADFGVVGADEVLTARDRGADVIPIFAVYRTSPQGIMVHASRGAKSIPAPPPRSAR